MRIRSLVTAALAVFALSAVLLSGVAAAAPAGHKVKEPLPPIETGGGCEFIANPGSSVCMEPFPDDYYTVADPSSATGRRIAFKHRIDADERRRQTHRIGAIQRGRRVQPRLGDPRQGARDGNDG